MSVAVEPEVGPRHHRRVALAVTTVGILAATLNSSILLISLPAIFAGLGLESARAGEHQRTCSGC